MFDNMFEENLWGTFGTAHGIAVIVAVLFTVLIYFLIRKQSRSKQIIVLFFLSLLGVVSLVYNFVNAEVKYEALPLNWWSINAILLPLAILTRGKRLCNLLLLWSLSSLLRISFLNISGAEWFTLANILSYITDVIGAGFVILLFELNLVKREHKRLKRILAISSLVYFVICIVNIILNTNYMCSASPENNVILAYLYSLFSVQHWYMILALPLAAFYLFWWYLPELLDDRKKNRTLKAKLKEVEKYYEEYEEEYIDEIIEEKYD